MSFLIKILESLSLKYAKTWIWFCLLGALASLALASQFLNFDTNQDNLISKEKKYFQDYKKFLEEFGDWEDIFVVVEVHNEPQKAKAFLKELAEKLKNKTELYQEIHYRSPQHIFINNLFLFLETTDFQKFISFLQNQPQLLKNFYSINSSAQWYAWLNSILSAQQISPEMQTALEKFWPFFKTGILAPFHENNLQDFHTTALLQSFSDRYIDPDGFYFNQDGSLLFMRILPHKDYESMEIIQKPLQDLRSHIQILNQKYPVLKVGLTGKPVLQNDEAVATSQDSEWASVASLLLVSLLFFLFVKNIRLPLFSLLSLLVAICWTTGFITIAFGSLNLLSIVFAIILIGMGIDYGVHFLLHYQHEKSLGHSNQNCIKNTLQRNTKAIFLAAFLTALGFGTALFTDFWGLKQLGMIAAVGIVLCCLMQLSFFPALLKSFDHRKITFKHLSRFRFLIAFANLSKRYPSFFLLFFCAAALFAFVGLKNIRFAFNLLELQDPTQESIKYERIITEKARESTSFLTYMTKNRDELRKLNQELTELSTVSHTKSISTLLPEHDQKRLTTLNQISEDIQHASVTLKSSSLTNELKRLKNNIDKLTNQAFASGQVEHIEELQSLSQKISKMLEQSQTSPFFDAPLEKTFTNRLSQIQSFTQNLFSPKEVHLSDLPTDLKKRYVSDQGYYSLSIYPKKDIWDWKNLTEFIQEVRTAIPDVTGAPITTYESAIRMKQGFLHIGLIASVLVFFFLVWLFREWRAPLFIFSGLSINFILLFGYMGMNGITINLANFFALPILIGTNVDHGIYLFHHFKESKDLKKVLDITVPPVFLSCFTNMAGFASLSFVRHVGLASFGHIMAIGTLIGFLVAILWLPALIRYGYKK